MLTSEQIDNIIDELEGTNLTLEDALNANGLDFDSLGPEDIYAIESEIFFCDKCENWVFIENESEFQPGVCRWCADDESVLEDEADNDGNNDWGC